LEQFRVDCLKDYEQILPLETEWEALHLNCTKPSFYNSFDFLYSAAHFLLENKADLRLFSVRNKTTNELIALFPFEETSFRWYFLKVKALEFTALQEVDKPFPVIKEGHTTKAWQALFLYLKTDFTGWDALNLLELDESCPEMKLFPALCRDHGFTQVTTECREGPLINLNKEWESFSSAHPKMRKKIRAMEKAYGDKLTFEFVADDWRKGYELYTQLEQKSWKKGEVGITKNPVSESFHKFLFERCAKNDKIAFGFLMVDGEPVSAEIAYCQGDAVYFCHGCYDEKFKKYSPGMVSTSFFLKHFFTSSYLKGDFLSGFANYLNAWSDEILRTKHVEILNASLFTRVVRFSRYLKRHIRAVIAKLPLCGRG